jgi:hypothetical protein
MNNETFDPNNSVQRQRFYGTNPIYSALARLHNFTEDTKELAYINWASIKPKILILSQTLRGGLERVMKEVETISETSNPCCGKNFGDINEEKYSMTNLDGTLNEVTSTYVLCNNKEDCSYKLNNPGVGATSCGYYSFTKDLKEL